MAEPFSIDSAGRRREGRLRAKVLDKSTTGQSIFGQPNALLLTFAVITNTLAAHALKEIRVR